MLGKLLQMFTHKCTPPPYTRKLLCQSLEWKEPHHGHGHGWALGAADSHFSGHLPPAWIEIREAWEAWKKFSGKSFLTNIHLTSYCIAILKLSLLGQAWDKPGLSKTFHWQEGSLLGTSPFPKKPGDAHLLVLGAAVWGCQTSGCREIPFSTGPHTLSAPLLSHTAGVGCRSVSVSVRSLNFQQ